MFLLSWLAAGCSDGARSDVGSSQQAPKIGSESHVESREISLLTTPNATCSVHPTGIADPAQVLDVYADDRGVVSFYAKPASSTESIRSLSLDCVSDGQATTRVLDLRDPAVFEPPAIPADRVQGTVRPALVEGASMNAMSQSQLQQMGYPPRPDAQGAPGLYAKWLAAVSKPTVLVTPKVVDRPDVHAASQTQGTNTGWGGTILTDGPYFMTIANIPVPSIPVSPAGAAVLWTGLGGINGDTALIQNGVWFKATGSAASLTPFYEYWRNAGRFVTNLPIHAGDVLQSWAWACDVNNNLSLSGDRGCFYFQNLTTGVAVSGLSWPRNSKDTPYSGVSAEYIVEPQASVLPNFGTVQIDGEAYAVASDGSNRSAYLSTDDILIWDLVNSSGTRATTTISLPETTIITWQSN
jgi:hypothetical protein